MQGFKAKKILLCALPSPFLHTAPILRIIPFHAFAAQARIEPGGAVVGSLAQLPLHYAACNNATTKCRI